MKAWLKGGLIFLGIVIFIVVIDLVPCIGQEYKEFCGFSALFVSLPLISTFTFLRISEPPIPLLLLLALVFWFGIGALIGLMIGKIKSKNNSILQKDNS